jgi:hypothetical protein
MYIYGLDRGDGLQSNVAHLLPHVASLGFGVRVAGDLFDVFPFFIGALTWTDHCPSHALHAWRILHETWMSDEMGGIFHLTCRPSYAR